MDTKRRLSGSVEKISRFGRVPRLFLIIGKWFLIVTSGLSLTFNAYLFYVIFSEKKAPPTVSAPVISMHDYEEPEYDKNTDETSRQENLEESSELPQRETPQSKNLLPDSFYQNESTENFEKPTLAQAPTETASEGQNKFDDVWADGRDEQKYYLPVTSFGRKDATKVLYFVWGSDEKSRKIFQDYVDPVIKKLIKNPRLDYKIKLLQIVGSKEYGIADPGSIFFCAKNSLDYAGISLGYLRSGGNIKEIYKGKTLKTRALYFNEISELTLKSAGYDQEKCTSDMTFFRQLRFAAIESVMLGKLIGAGNETTLKFDGRIIDINNNNALNRFRREIR